jgi:hypothetical protein
LSTLVGIYGIKGLFEKVDKISLQKSNFGEIMNSEYFGECFYTPIAICPDRYLYRLEKSFYGGEFLFNLFQMGENCKESGIGDLKLKRSNEFYSLGKDRCMMQVGKFSMHSDGTTCEPEFVIDNGYCLGYDNWLDLNLNINFTNIHVIHLRRKKIIFLIKISQKYKSGVEKYKLCDYDVKLYRHWAVFRLKKKEKPMTMVINYSTKKVKRSNEDLNPEAFVDASFYPQEHYHYEHRTRFNRMIVPDKFRSNNPDYKVFVKDYCFNLRGEVIFHINTPDSNILYNASKESIINWFPELNYSQKNDPYSKFYEIFTKNQYYTCKLQFINTTDQQSYKKKPKIRQIRVQIRSLCLKSQKIDYENLQIDLSTP